MRITGTAHVQADELPPGAIRFQATTQFEWKENVYMAPMKYTCLPGNAELRRQLDAWLSQGKIKIVEGP